MFLKKLRTQMRLIMIIVVVAFLLSTFLMYEGRSRRTPHVNADGTIADYEVAEVNGRPLMRSELERRLRQAAENTRQRDLTSRDMPGLYQAAFDQYVLDSQMAKEVEAQGIRVSDADAEVAMKAYADRFFPTREAFYLYLSQIGVKVEDYKKAVARQMANEQLIRNAIGQVVISDDATLEFYDTMKDLLYLKPEGFNVYLANFESSADANALRDALAGGKTWTEAISDDRFASIDSDKLTREPMFLPTTALSGILQPLLSLDIGEVSPIFSLSSNDYSVGLKAEKVSESVTPYDDVSADIKTLLRQQQERVKLNEFQQSLMEKAQFVIYDNSLFPQPTSDDEMVPEEPEAEVKPEEVKPEVKAEEVKPEVKTEEVKPEGKAEEVKPEVKTEEVKPEGKAEEATPEVKAEEVKPEVKTEEVKPEGKAEEVKPEVKAEEVKPEVKTEEAKPEIKAEEVKPEVKAEVATPEVKTEEVKPEVKAEEVKPEVKTEEVKPEGKTEEVKPEIKAEEVKPEVKAEVATPEVKTEEVKPEVKAEEVKPEVKTEEVKPEGKTELLTSESRLM